MTDSSNPQFDALERVFHEPNRLAILSALCAADSGLTFGALKQACNLTDGNLNRHLNALAQAEVVAIHKSFVGVKPCTTVTLTRKGLTRFTAYLAALQQVLEHAQSVVPENAPAMPATGVRVRPVHA